MAQKFPTSLFEFDFVAESNELSVKDAIRKREAHRATLIPCDCFPSEPSYIVENRLEELRELADAAFEDERMDVYFRLLDEIERWESAEVLDV